MELGLPRGDVSEAEMESSGLGMRRKGEGDQAGLRGFQVGAQDSGLFKGIEFSAVFLRNACC